MEGSLQTPWAIPREIEAVETLQEMDQETHLSARCSAYQAFLEIRPDLTDELGGAICDRFFVEWVSCQHPQSLGKGLDRY